MPRKNLRRAASKEALKQMQLLSASAYEDDDNETETFEITSDDDVVSVDMPPKKKYRLSHRKSSDGNDRDVIVLKSVNPTEESLRLETWTEELSEVQLAAHAKVNQELKELNNKIELLTKQVSAEIIYQSENCTALELDNVIPPLSYTNAKKKASTISSSKAQQNVVLQQSKGNSAQNAYQLVMDPRLGLIVGTMTPTASPTVPPQLAKSQSPAPAPPAIQTRQTRRRGRNSVQINAIPQQQQTTPAKTSSVSSVIQLRPTESTAVGGLSTGATTTTVQKSNNVTSSAVVDLTADEGRPAADSREISFNKLQGKTFPSLVVVARPHLSVKDNVPDDRTKLDSKVKSVLMHVPTKFTEWLIQQGLVRSEQTCVNHPNTKLKLGMYSDVSKFPYSGGYVWISECCPHRFVSVFSGSLFEGSPHPPSVILKLIYHWACQTNVQNVVQWVKVDNLYVKGMNTWLRAICTVALHSHIAPLGGAGRRVEVGVISLGTTSQDGQQRQVKVEVLGLLETDLKRIRLRAVEPVVDGDRNYKKRFSKILEPLLHWVHPDSIIVTDLTVDKSTLHGMGFAHVLQSTSNDHNASNHTIMEYLRRIVPRMFQNTLSLLSRQIIQQFLDELVWREWYGTTAAQCFDNMLTHLSEQTRADIGQSLIMRLNKVAANPFKNWSIIPSTQPTTIISKPPVNEPPQPAISITSSTKRTSNRQRKIIVRSVSPPPEIQPQRPPRTISPDVPEQMVPLENYYYGTIEGHDPHANMKIGWNIKCSMCKSHFSNNIKLMNHLFSHAHSITGGIQQCRYCLSSVGSQEGLAKHIITSHPYETRFQDGFVCVICETRFPNSFSLGKHLSKEHVPSELPYQCGTCNFRCSSHRQAIDHFYNAHDSGITIQCPFCLKATSVWSGGRVMPQNLNYFMQHLQKHQKKAMAKKCSKCALWFIHKDTLKEHQINMHTTQRRKAGLIPWAAPRNGLMVPKSKQDRQVWEDSEREINFNTLIINAPNKLVCKECKVGLNSPKHFQSLESCSNRNCQYLTCCKNAMETHLKICKDLNTSLPIHMLAKEMHCVCGYSDDDGNILAKHLAECERKSAYPTADAAKGAIKTHSMLDVLGLVRRPEEPPAATAVVQNTNPPSISEVIEIDDNDEKEEEKSEDAVKEDSQTVEQDAKIVEQVAKTEEKEDFNKSTVTEVSDNTKMDVDDVIEVSESAKETSSDAKDAVEEKDDEVVIVNNAESDENEMEVDKSADKENEEVVHDMDKAENKDAEKMETDEIVANETENV
ncbi:hypothetical protein ILUMI_24523 [Ignelater luminosus]|uniref:C2H2-type domain-containing protein n=1 Tax=Ignelater luminosus TaxID=2038154 RepID=A0A8K0CAC7_IGNLU|nr:hypothetical protein ILUMI_24523 [Ignelater luminosus]